VASAVDVAPRPPIGGAALRWAARGRDAARCYPRTTLVLLLGVIARAILIPITHGQDFVVWDLASLGTIRGVNVFAHHPHYPGGPYTYFPLFLYAELPFQWLAVHLDWSFTILGKLPIVAGDALAAVLIAAYLKRAHRGDAAMALGAGLYFLNPLVLYNGAFYGRFDAFCVGLFMLALWCYDGARARSWRWPLLYSLAVAAKTYPGFILPWILVRDRARRGRVIVALVAVLSALSLPYLISSPKPFIRDIVLYNGGKLPGSLSWQIVWLDVFKLGDQPARLISYVLLAAFVLALFLFTRLDLYTYCAVAILLFLFFSKVVIEQYLIWPLPFLILLAVGRGSRASWGLVLLFTAAGTAINPYIHPLGQRVLWVNILLGLCILAYVVTRRAGGTPGTEGPMAEYGH
jgi:hypothetical protein